MDNSFVHKLSHPFGCHMEVTVVPNIYWEDGRYNVLSGDIEIKGLDQESLHLDDWKDIIRKSHDFADRMTCKEESIPHGSLVEFYGVPQR